MNIGTHIKQLRKDRQMTQEQLADLLHISSAAVSKWESGDCYPDITLLIPLAQVFNVSLDTLLGYNEAELEREITLVLENCRSLERNGRYEELTKVLAYARGKYPNDYRIMNRYMWNLAGGTADNNLELLLAHEEEFRSICVCILNGCKDEKIRLDALNMQAKLFHAHGETEKALEALMNFPDGAHCSEQKIEQLYEKDTQEYRLQLTRNLYRHAHVFANKLMKRLRHASDEKAVDAMRQSELLADHLLALYQQTKETSFVLMAQMCYGCIAGSLSFDHADPAVILRVRDKEIECFRIMEDIAHEDDVLRELLVKTYGTTELAKWLVDYLNTTDQGALSYLQRDEQYRAHWNDK